MTNNKISACIIAYNEEKIIKRCLESIKNVVDEIIFIHDGPCKDKTLEIARKYTSKIFIRNHVGEAEAHRPFSYEKASGPWILKIDADEFLTKPAQQAMRKMVERNDIDGYALSWPIWDGKRYLRKIRPYKLCLFRKSKLSFIGFPHAVEEVNGKVLNVDYELGHKPLYNNYLLSTFKTKWLRWARIQAEYTLKDFKDLQKFNYKKKEHRLIIRLEKNIPEILAIPFAKYIFFKCYIQYGYYKLGRLGFNYSLMQGLYRLALCYYIHKFKRNKK